MATTSTFRIFVSTVSDSLAGRWVNPIEECESEEEFSSLCEEIVAEYGEEEFMFPDFENGLSGFCTEYMGCALAWEIAEALNEAELDGNSDAFRAYCSMLSRSSEINYNNFVDAFIGEYSDGAEYAEQIADECGELENVPNYIKYHIDWEAVWNNELSYDYFDVYSNHGTLYIFHN